MNVRLATCAALALALGATGPVRADDQAARTSIKDDPFADDEPQPEGDADVEVDTPSATPSPNASAAATPAPAVARPTVLVVIKPASPLDAADALAIGELTANLLANARNLTALSTAERLDPDRARRHTAARAAALAMAARGRDALESLDLEPAREQLEEAALALAALDTLDRPSEAALQECLLGLAVAALYDSDLLRADSAFVALAALLANQGRDAPLLADLRRYPSKVIARFEATRAELEGRATGRVAAKSSPPGAVVRIDGVERGRAPTEVGGLAEGLHLVVLGGPGLVPVASLVDVVASESVPVDRQLSAAPLTDALAAVPRADDVRALAAWADSVEARWVFVGEQSALGTVRGAWLDADDLESSVRVEAVVRGGTEGAARALVAAIETAEAARRMALAPPPVVADDSEPLTAQWWFWAGIGGAVAVAAGTAIALTATADGPPRGTAIFGF